MSAMAAPPRFDSVLSFGTAALPEVDTVASSDAGSDYDDDDDAGFEFAFAPPLAARGSGAAPDLAPADDLFAHGRILPAYPVFDRHLLAEAPQHPSTAPPSPDTYCAWAPRSAPGSPARERDPTPSPAAFPKSASTGEARRFWRLRGLVSGSGGGGGRSHSDGKEKFVFLQPAAAPSKMSGSKAKAAATAADGSSSSSRQGTTTKASAPAQKQSKKKKGAKSGAVTEMDMATAHKLFYGKQGAGALAGDRRQHQQQSYLPYRPGIVGFFAAAHALGRSHHPY